MAKHTPGPWRYNCSAGDTIWAEFEPVAEVHRGKSEIANGRLIAAAPELLEALCECAELIETLKGDCEALDLARAAVLKATGEE